MIRPRSAAAALALVAPLVLVGCPIPQPLPDYPPGQPVTPPRIVVNDTVHVISPSETVVRVPAGCPTDLRPSFPLAAMLRHELTNEAVASRWFVDYDPTSQDRSRIVFEREIPAPATTDGTTDPTLRTVPTYTFSPYDFPPFAFTGGGNAASPGALHVVELVVSNGFDPAADVPPPAAALPYRTPKLNFEVQVFRWVFVTTPDVPCPTPTPL